jgi:hypothetical protein
MRRALLCTAIVLTFVGCASIQAQDTRATEQLLTEAGFQARPADTPEKLAHLQTLPRRIVRGERDGQASYVFADRDVCKCLYMGTEQQYQAYRSLARQKNIADEDKVVAEDMSDYRAWGVWGLFP